MARIVVRHGIGDLANDLAAIPAEALPKFSATVRRSTEQGTAIARNLARQAAGPHGKNYYKRISGELVSPLAGEYGPEGDVVGNAVGAGWRGGVVNTDLEKSQDVIGPKFADAIGDDVDGLFW